VADLEAARIEETNAGATTKAGTQVGTQGQQGTGCPQGQIAGSSLILEMLAASRLVPSPGNRL
jgi:hypothetical protein